MKQPIVVLALLVLGVAMGDAVQYFEKVDHNETQVPLPNGKVQVLDGEICIRIQDVANEAYPECARKESCRAS